MTYKAGDKVWVTVGPGHHVIPAGDHPGVVLGGTRPIHFYPKFLMDPWYDVDIAGGYKGGPWKCPESILKPREDPYDGNKVVRWDDCPWQPETILVDR